MFSWNIPYDGSWKIYDIIYSGLNLYKIETFFSIEFIPKKEYISFLRVIILPLFWDIIREVIDGFKRLKNGRNFETKLIS